MNLFVPPDYATWVVFALSNAGAVGLLMASIRRPLLARFLFSLLFAGASVYNAYTVLNSPWVYAEVAEYAVLDVYRWFMLGPFERVAKPLVLLIAAGQAFIALSMGLTGRPFRWGCRAGLFVCVGISPLGLGAAFPMPLLLAAGFHRLHRHPADYLLWKRPVRRQPRKPALRAHT